MHVASVLSRWLEEHALVEHKARTSALVRIVASALSGAKLSLTHLGRGRSGDTFEKHHIKAVDRLLGNRWLHLERAGIYAAIARAVLHRVKRPVIVVDWSDFEPGRKLILLKAAVPIGGRAITIYERVFPFARCNSPSAHREFLVSLQAVVPQRCKPIIVTDAGFRGPWFHAVQQLGWDFVGRIRNRIKYFNRATGRWCFTYVGLLRTRDRHPFHSEAPPCAGPQGCGTKRTGLRARGRAALSQRGPSPQKPTPLGGHAKRALPISPKLVDGSEPLSRRVHDPARLQSRVADSWISHA